MCLSYSLSQYKSTWCFALNFLSILYFAFSFRALSMPSEAIFPMLVPTTPVLSGGFARQFIHVSSLVGRWFCWPPCACEPGWAAYPEGPGLDAPTLHNSLHTEERGKVTGSGWSVRSGLARLQAFCFLGNFEQCREWIWSRQMCIPSLAPPRTGYDFEQGP